LLIENLAVAGFHQQSTVNNQESAIVYGVDKKEGTHARAVPSSLGPETRLWP